MSLRSPRPFPAPFELALPIGRLASVRFWSFTAPYPPISGSWPSVLAVTLVRPRADGSGGDVSRAIFFCLGIRPPSDDGLQRMCRPRMKQAR